MRSICDLGNEGFREKKHTAEARDVVMETLSQSSVWLTAQWFGMCSEITGIMLNNNAQAALHVWSHSCAAQVIHKSTQEQFPVESYGLLQFKMLVTQRPSAKVQLPVHLKTFNHSFTFHKENFCSCLNIEVTTNVISWGGHFKFTASQLLSQGFPSIS